MWETTVTTRKSVVVDASTERVRSLVGSVAAWSVRPGFFGFVLDGSVEDGKLCGLVRAGACGQPVRFSVADVCDDGPGRVIRWRGRGAGNWDVAFAITPHRRGTLIEAMGRQTAKRIHMPGTPPGQVGAIDYDVRRRAGGHLTANLIYFRGSLTSARP